MNALEIFLIGFSLLLSLLLFLVVRSYLRLEDEHIKLQERFEDKQVKNCILEDRELLYEAYIDELQRKTEFIQKDLKKIKEVLNANRTSN